MFDVSIVFDEVVLLSQRSVAELLSASLFSSHTVDAQLELANHLAHATPAVQVSQQSVAKLMHLER